ncbi:MAG TPA: hypothetical protein VGQ39_17555 [Pyrinomonadaceae bacterium]|jgi:hypothetical protein|nr:hypothetical protein [Pyrinomonadaceae bacterium]
MKKLVVSIACLVALSFAAIPVGAQTRSRCTTNRTGYDRRYDRSGRVYSNQVSRNNSYRYGGYNNQVYSNSGYYDNSAYYGNDGYYDNRSVWQRSRDKITTAAGAGAGALIGGMIGGKRGAIIGAIAGGGGAAVYTYKIRDKYRRY